MIYLLTVFGVPLTGGAAVPFRFGTVGYVTKPTDVPSNAYFEERIKDIGAFTKDLYGDSRTYGSTRISFGSCILVNSDGGLDHLNNYAFDGQDYQIDFIPSDKHPFSSKVIIQQGKLRDIEISLSEVNLILKDDLFSLDKPLLDTKYLGNNALPNGIEGTQDDIKGKVKPIVYGEVKNITPVLVNTSKLVYQVSVEPVAEILAYDGGVSLTYHNNFTDLNLFLNHTIPSGNYITLLQQGLVRLHSNPSFQLTCDVKESLISTNNRTGSILSRIAQRVHPDTTINTASVQELDTTAPYTVGAYINDESTALSVMDSIAESVSAYFIYDNSKLFSVGRISEPTGTSSFTFDELNIVKDSLSKERSRDTDRGIPAYRVTVNYLKNYTVLSDTDIAGVVKSSQQGLYGFLMNEVRAVNSTDLTVKDIHPEATEIIRNTLLLSSADAQSEANRILTLYKTRRDVYRFIVRVDYLSNIQSLQIGSIIELKVNRFGLNAGKKFVVLTVTNDFTSNRLELTVWG